MVDLLLPEGPPRSAQILDEGPEGAGPAEEAGALVVGAVAGLLAPVHRGRAGHEAGDDVVDAEHGHGDPVGQD